MSETTSLGVSNPVFGLRKAGSIGIPWPDYGCPAGGRGRTEKRMCPEANRVRSSSGALW